MIWRAIGRLLGVRLVEGPDAIRITVPRWMGRSGLRVLQGVQQKAQADQSVDGWRFQIVGRSLIGRVREDDFR